MKKWISLWTALLLCMVSLAAAAEGTDNWLDTVLDTVSQSLETGEIPDLSTIALPELKLPETTEKKEKPKYVASLLIEGELSESDYYYDHAGTLEAIDGLIGDEKNIALLLLLNTPGGYLYESDELYHAVMTYKQETGRPVYAYMKQECCSGGVFVAMAADTIMAARMTLTGSVGVYTTSYSEAGFYQKLGIEQEYITTGDNKVSGYPTLTEEQRAIDQALIEESFVFFKQVIAESRGLTQEQMAPFLDGRLLSAIQAKEYGLIDEVLYYDQAMKRILAELGEETEVRDVTPTWEDAYDLYDYAPSFLDWILP